MSSDTLHDFDGLPVRKATIAVTHAGDGLSEALSIDPREYHLEDRVYVVLETVCSKVGHAPLPEKEGEGLVRVHTLKAGRASIVDRELVIRLLEAQQAKIDEAKGVVPFPGMSVVGDTPTEPKAI